MVATSTVAEALLASNLAGVSVTLIGNSIAGVRRVPEWTVPVWLGSVGWRFFRSIGPEGALDLARIAALGERQHQRNKGFLRIESERLEQSDQELGNRGISRQGPGDVGIAEAAAA